MKATTTPGVFRTVILVVAFVSAMVSFGEAKGGDRYKIILERRPFGEEALPVVEPPVSPVPPDQSIINQIRMSAVVRDEAGVLRVGLVDVKTKRNFMLGIGESMDGLEVVGADYAAERARLRRGQEDYWVSMQGGSNRFERVVAEPANKPSVQAGAGVRAEESLPDGVDQKRSYILRRQQREEARLRRELDRLRAMEAERIKAAAQTPAAEGGAAGAGGIMRAGSKKDGDASGRALVNSLMNETDKIELTDEEIGRMLQEYQKELIRKGQRALPIPLTPETDRQLVEEGLLPAME